jgi:hydrogenase maturation protease
MQSPAAGVLVIGYGNPGRRDDGLGPAFADALARLDLPGVRVEADYQLGVEDAADAAASKQVLFVDADTRGPAPFWVKRLSPAGADLGFSTHSVSPEAVLALAKDLFGAEPETWLMGIRGYLFNEFGEGLSDRAAANLAAALDWAKDALTQRALAAVRDPASPGPAATTDEGDA